MVNPEVLNDVRYYLFGLFDVDSDDYQQYVRRENGDCLLLKEETIAKKLNISRTLLRETMIHLSCNGVGLITRDKPGGPIRILRPSTTDVEEIFRTRKLIERDASLSVHREFDQFHKEELRDTLNYLNDKIDSSAKGLESKAVMVSSVVNRVEDIWRIDAQFHQHLLCSGGYATFATHTSVMRDRLRLVAYSRSQIISRSKRNIEQHNDIINAIVAPHSKQRKTNELVVQAVEFHFDDSMEFVLSQPVQK